MSGLGESDRRYHKQRIAVSKNAVHWYLAEIPEDELFTEKNKIYINHHPFSAKFSINLCVCLFPGGGGLFI